MSDNNIRKKLSELGTDKLVDALIKLAETNDEAANLVHHIVATPSENIARFKNKLRNIRKRKRFIGWGESRYFAQELKSLLEDLEAGVKSSEVGLTLISKFYESDQFIFEICDDSSGHVGEIFSFDANELFTKFANNCDEKDLILKQLTKLYQKDSYGVKFNLIESAYKYLSPQNLQNLFDIFEKESEKFQADSYEKSHWQMAMQSLAKQLKDGSLYEKVCFQMSPELSSSTCLDIASVYLEADNAEKALHWINNINSEDHFRTYEKNKLLLAIYKKLGDKKKMTEIAWDQFRKHRNEVTFMELLNIIGKNKKKQVLQGESALILKQSTLSLGDAKFLLKMGLINEAEKYLLAHHKELNGDHYGTILPLAVDLEKNRKYLSSSILYRSLLESILKRAISKYYHHGVRYLKKLDELALNIADWEDCTPHHVYRNDLLQQHNRKSSFWKKYNEN